MRTTVVKGELYRLTAHERTCSKCEFTRWTFTKEGKWKPTRDHIDVKPFEFGLLCVDKMSVPYVARSYCRDKHEIGIFSVGESFVAIGADYIERAEKGDSVWEQM